MPKFTLDPRAETDLLEIWEFIGQDNESAANRVVEAAFETFAVLAGSPKIGTSFAVASRSQTEVRRWPVKGFKNYQIFYRPVSGGIDVLRVYHVARSTEQAFEE